MTSETPTPPATPTSIARTAVAVTPSTEMVSTSTTVKPGWRSTEFWAMWAVKIPGALLALGLVGPANAASRIVGAAMMVLSLLGYTWARTLVKTAAMLLVLMFLPLNSGCGSNARQTTVRDSLVAIDTASSAFTSYDALHQQDIVKNATTREQAESQLQAWRERRAVAVYTISAAYRAVALVATDDKQPLQLLASAVKLATDTISQLGVKL